MGGIGTRMVDEEGKKFQEPKKVDPKLREQLGIFEEEENVRSPAVVSMDDPNFYSNYKFEVTPFQDLSSEKNYSSFPVSVLHNVFLLLKPSDLISLFSSCRYFYKAGLSNVFWKKYYIHFFGLYLQENENMDDLNYKKQFFKRYSDCRCANLYYLKNHRPIFISENNEDDNPEYVKIANDDEYGMSEVTFGSKKDDVNDDYDNKFFLPYRGGQGYALCGAPGIGKRSLLIRLLLKGEYNQKNDEQKNPELQNEQLMMIHFNVFKRKYRHTKEYSEIEEPERTNVYLYEREFRRIRILSTLDKDTAERRLCESQTDSWIFCFIAGDRKTFQIAKKFVKEFSSRLKSGVPKKQRRRGVLVGLKSDLLHSRKREVTKKEIKKFIDSNLLKGYVECSAKENTSCYLPFGILVAKHAWRYDQAGG